MIRFLCLSALTAAIALSAPAQAQSRRELAERIDATEVRIGTLESEFMAGDPVAEALIRRMDELEYQVQALTGETERLSFENRQLRQQIETLEAEAEARQQAPAPVMDDAAVAWMNEGLDGSSADADGATLAIVDPDDPHAEARAAATGVLGGSAGPEAANSEIAAVDPAVTFEAARARLVDSDFIGAQSGFEAFIADNPDHALTAQAQYWLGETFYVRSDFTQAADAFIASLRLQPAGDKAPDALVRLAASLHGMGRTEDACSTLAQFGRQFPNAAPASQARAARESVRANCR